MSMGRCSRRGSTLSNVWLCPSDGNNGGRIPSVAAASDPTGAGGDSHPSHQPSHRATRDRDRGHQTTPAASATTTPEVRSAAAVCPGKRIPAQTCPRVHRELAGTATGEPSTAMHPDFTVGGGSLRGLFDYQTVQFVRLASVTDGTSNTIMGGEVLPIQSADSNFWNENGCFAGTTIPINWNSNTIAASDPSCYLQLAGPRARLPLRRRGEGLQEHASGGSNFMFGDGSVHFLKASISIPTYAALGSRGRRRGHQLRLLLMTGERFPVGAPWPPRRTARDSASPPLIRRALSRNHIPRTAGHGGPRGGRDADLSHSICVGHVAATTGPRAPPSQPASSRGRFVSVKVHESRPIDEQLDECRVRAAILQHPAPILDAIVCRKKLAKSRLGFLFLHNAPSRLGGLAFSPCSTGGGRTQTILF